MGEFLRTSRSEWRAVHSRDPYATPFHHPDWIAAWWDVFGSSHQDGVALCAYGDGELVAVLPLTLDRTSEGTLTARCAGDGLTDYCGWVAAPTARAVDLLHLVLRALAGLGVHALSLADISARSPLGRALHADGLPRGGPVRVGESCPRLTFPARWETYWEGRGRHLRQLVARSKRREEKAGPVRTVFSTTPRAGEMRLFIDMHLSWWRERGRDSLLEYPTAQELLVTAAERFARSGGLVLSAQKSGSATTAMFLLFDDGKSRYYYQSAVNPEYSHLRPGLLHMHDVAHLTARSGYARFDLLRGSERYKMQFANQVSRNVGATFMAS
ncbi:GNAT family N-acetyltransferase [Streptomyces sp. NPDC057702]|uniref:GNAT family N-acetyltransferase n=1 Tax=Streptomyces sp. NPDC057702 TaxID=3346221 RepID=UPI00369015B8